MTSAVSCVGNEEIGSRRERNGNEKGKRRKLESVIRKHWKGREGKNGICVVRCNECWVKREEKVQEKENEKAG